MRKHSEALTLARQCHRSGDLSGAEQLCRQILHTEPARLKALYLLGGACHGLGKLDEALRCFDRILRDCPASARGHHARGSVLQDQGDLGQAVRAFEEAARLRPGFVAAQVSLGLSLQAQGKVKKAAACFREVLRLRPDLPESHLAVGTILESEGKLDDAAACYREALRLNPECAGALNNLGALLLKRDKMAEAADSIAQTLRLKPDMAEAHYNQGAIWHRRRHLGEAIDCYRRAIRLQPGFMPAYHALATALIEDGQHDTARDWIQKALHFQPGQALAHANLGKLFLHEGRRAEAVTSFREALRQDPNCVAALAPVAFFGTFPLSDDELNRIKSLLAKGGLPPAEASRLYFGLGSLSDRAGAFDEAFAHFRQANRLRRQTFREADMAFDHDIHRAWIDQFIATCDTAYFQRVKEMGQRTERPVFIVGMPRSGTSLVEQILASHPDIFGAGELRDIDQIAQGLPAQLRSLAPVTPVVGGEGPEASSGYPLCLGWLDGATANLLADRYLERLARLDGPALRVTDKMPLNFLHLGLIAAMLPRARIIHCVRDPLDVCLSCYFQDFGSVNFSSDLEDLGRFYRDYERLMAHWRAVLPLPLMEVGYEDLVENQEAVSRRMVAFCGLGWDDRCLAYHQNPRPVHTASQVQVRQPVYKSSVGRWRQYATHLQPLFLALGRSPEHP